MALTPLRWVAAVIAGCLMSGVVLLRTDPPSRPESSVEQRLARRAERLAGHATNTADRLHLVQLLDSVNTVVAQPTSPLSVRVFHDAALPAEYAAVLDSAGWRALAPVRDSGHVGVDIVFLYDTVKMVRGSTVRRWYGARPDYVLPRNTSERCRVIVHIPPFAQSPRSPLTVWRGAEAAERVAGPCLYYRAFGMPGPQVDAWLRTRGWSFAEGGSWSQGSSEANFADDRRWLNNMPLQAILGMKTSVPFLYGMSINGVRCVAARVDACDRALLEKDRFGPVLLNGTVLNHPFRSWSWDGWNSRGLGWREWMLLADMVRTVGRDRFGRFWTSDKAVPAAFESATGEPVGEWTTRWAVSQYGVLPGMGPGLSRTGGAMTVVLILLALLITLRAGARRQFA